MIDYDNNIFIHTHLGLGDHIVCNGMVRYILKNCDNSTIIKLLVKNKYQSIVADMYRDETRIEMFPVEESKFYQSELDWKKIKLVRAGFEKCRPIDWAVSLYDSVNISFSERWDSFYYKRDKIREQKLIDRINLPSEFILVHDTSSVGKFDLKIKSTIPIVKVEPIDEFGIFSWLGVVERSKEIHCIDSSFAHMVESFNGICSNLNFHDAKNNGVLFSRKQNWNFIKYGEIK